MSRSAAAWTRLECDGADIAFREHWGGIVEIACGESRVMLSYCGLQRLAKLSPESATALLIALLKTACAEQRNRAQAELLSDYLERNMQHSGGHQNPLAPDTSAG
jgi:hypothetical protein